MSFSSQEKTNISFNALFASVSSTPSQAWYESLDSYESAVFSDVIIDKSLFNTIPYCSSLSAARSAAISFPSLIEDKSHFIDAIRMTPIVGTNGQIYVSYSTYGNVNSTRLKLWINPQWKFQSNVPSKGYAIQLYNGNPNSGGVLISTTYGTTGTGVNKNPGWIFSYTTGTLLLSSSIASTITDPYIVGFRWIGTFTGGSGSSVKRYYFSNKKNIIIDNIYNLPTVEIWPTIGNNFLLNKKLANILTLNKKGEQYFQYNTYVKNINVSIFPVVYDKSKNKVIITLDKKRSGFILINESVIP